MGQVKQDENMRQRARHEPAIGTISSGIEYEMTREREPPPSYHRHQRRFTELTAHTTLPSPSGGQRDGTVKRKTGRTANRRGKRDAEPRYHITSSQERNRPMRKMTERHRRDSQATQPSRANRSRIANERERESGTVRKQAGRSQSCPQPQIR